MNEAERQPTTGEWPELPYERWRDTRDTLHMCLQVIGKVRLALTPREPQWANVPLYLTARGLTTSPMAAGRTTLAIDVDFFDHRVVLSTADGRREHVPLVSRPVADFYHELVDRLRGLGVEARIWPVPVEVPNPIRFPDDTVHATYDPAWAQRFCQVLSRVDLVMKEHRSRFLGRTSPVQFFWGTFDLATSRFSGRPAEPPPGADFITRVGADAEQVESGFWPGDARFEEAAFFAFGYPRPEGIEDATVRPGAAGWNRDLGEFILTYADLRRLPDPRRALLDFLDSTYEACAARLGWDPALVARG